MSGYPRADLYEVLYARYFQRPPDQLLELAGPLGGKYVLDLCGGTGRAALAALRLGASFVHYVDQEPEMAPEALRRHPQIKLLQMNVQQALGLFPDAGFDLIVCQQAVNYWLPEVGPAALARVLTPGGAFVFNTFNTAPPLQPQIKEYELGGRRYAEVSYRVGDIVHHGQYAEGLAPHQTSFAWIPPEAFRQTLSGVFEIQEERHGRTSLYCCRKSEH